MLIVDDDILDAKGVADMLLIDVQTVKRLANKGQLPGFRIGNRWRFKKSDIDAHIEELKQKQQRQKD